MAVKVVVGADHNGFYLRQELLAWLKREGYDVLDVGDDKLDPADDFPLFAERVASGVLQAGPDGRGIIICGSGQGVCMAANRRRGIRAALGYNEESAEVSRTDDNANVLCLPARMLSAQAALNIVRVFLKTDFSAAPRFIRRLRQLDEL